MLQENNDKKLKSEMGCELVNTQLFLKVFL